ncbi:plant UBX domain-containing protein 8 isoform X1 [Lactuca sativa]|uniref:UBX domain-containing protein n=1 Tax=Lactuca sativa TaxID=4236 RepID=A0A9R1W5K2_LACSA|nr:plant UBX domain-containing protein 8 isoform X1 [Lactuca sativa]KAJ0217559.1 hypothetical protein LSAT_V11C300103800 [Lactuca sativa]
MATPNQESIETFMSITGSSGPVAIQKLTEHGGNLNEAVNSYFTQGDTNIRHQTDVADHQEDLMDIDEEPSETSNHRPPFLPFPASAPRIENVIDTLPENPGTLRSIDDDDDDFPSLRSSHLAGLSGQNENLFSHHDTDLIPSAPGVSDLPDYGIEEEMIRAAIEASKHDAEISQPDDVLLVQQESEAGPSETRASKLSVVEEAGASASSNKRLGVEDGSEDTDEQEQPLVRVRHTEEQQNINNHVDNWGGMSSEEHDEAVMLEAAMFGGIPEGIGHRVRYARHRNMQNGFNRGVGVGAYPRPPPRPTSPSLTAQRLIREQQDDEYLAALQADREKELLAMEEARQKEEEAQKKLDQEQEIERQLTAKEASLPEEPKPDDENVVSLLVRMPDGSRRGRRFLRSHKLQYLFDFIDVGRVVKPTTYRLVRPYPRRAFGDEESKLSLNEVGLSSKQEALFLELI